MIQLTDGKIFGLVTPTMYVKVMYYLLMGVAAYGVLAGLLIVGGVVLPLGMLALLAGLIALLKAILGLTLFKEAFSGVDRNHFGYVCILFLAFYILGILLAAIGGIGLIVSIIISAIQFVLYYTGFNSWTKARMITAANFTSEVQSAVKRS